MQCITEDGFCARGVLRKAEPALDRAKATGKNKTGLARKKNMVAKTTYYSTEQLQRLSSLSLVTGIGEDEILREGLEGILMKYEGAAAKETPRVMIVDDSQMMMMMLEDCLVKSGYKVAAKADNGIDAVNIYNGGETFDYVLLNVTMPKMDGIDALADFRKDRNTRIIMVTSTKHPSLVLASIANGAHHILYRPFETGDLMEVMNSDGVFKKENFDFYKKYIDSMNLQDTQELTQQDITNIINAV